MKLKMKLIEALDRFINKWTYAYPERTIFVTPPDSIQQALDTVLEKGTLSIVVKFKFPWQKPYLGPRGKVLLDSGTYTQIQHIDISNPWIKASIKNVHFAGW